MNFKTQIEIHNRTISRVHPVYFIADLASNHDGDINRAKKLIVLAKKSGADAVKFQHFKASTIVSDFGFKDLGGNFSHQKNWTKSVYDIYQDYECNLEWTRELVNCAKKQNIDLLTTPYDFETADFFENIIPAYKIGSGDITWIEFLEHIAKKGKPIIISTGASTLIDVQRAVTAVLQYNTQIALLQCNTNYTGDKENSKYANLNVLNQYATLYPGMTLGLSDHTQGNILVLGAIALGARIVEKHFTDDCRRKGPDHQFSLEPSSWKEMIIQSRELEAALGNGEKIIEDNEKETSIIQRRCLRVNKDIHPGDIITRKNINALRPCPENGIQPFDIGKVLCKRLKSMKHNGEALYHSDFED